jgi:hypothetical protein
LEERQSQHRRPLEEDELRSYFVDALRATREILAEYGGHGDLRLVYKLDRHGRDLRLSSGVDVASDDLADRQLLVELDTTFDDNSAERRVFAEVHRAAGLGPRPSNP